MTFFKKAQNFCTTWSTCVSTLSELNLYVNSVQVLQLWKENVPIQRPPVLEPVHGADQRARIPMTPLSQMQVSGGVPCPTWEKIQLLRKTRNPNKNLKRSKWSWKSKKTNKQKNLNEAQKAHKMKIQHTKCSQHTNACNQHTKNPQSAYQCSAKSIITSGAMESQL